MGKRKVPGDAVVIATVGNKREKKEAKRNFQIRPEKTNKL